ncbi:MAG: AAA family ATPase [Chloroflexi bacterium]|nr:AAA family ATPase [Chloroflexota bacterium]
MSTELEDRQFEVISAGAEDVDRTLGGGIPYRTLMLIEGQSASGKSTLAQQLVWGALGSGEKAAVYTTEQTVHSFLRQTTSLGLDVRDYFLMGLLHIYPISIAPDAAAPEVLFEELRRHIMNQKDCRVILVDALSTFVSSTGGDQIQGFFNGCKSLCDEGKVVICTVHTDAFDPSILTRVRSICDAHLRLEVGKVGGRLQKTIEVAKIRGADSSTGNISGFEIDPGLGIRIVPISIARA